MNSNRFAHLDQVTTKYDDPPSIKKALKKLREIQALEGKPNLSPEEQIKVSKKIYWEIIANIKQPPEAKKVNDQKKQEAKERHIKLEQERNKQKERERQAKEANEQKKQEEKEWRQERTRQTEERNRQQEREHKEKELKEAKERYVKKYKELKEILLEQKLLYISTTNKDLEIEWAVSLRYIYNNNVLKTFRRMSVKYHPDKCKWGNDVLQKHLGHLRDVYLK